MNVLCAVIHPSMHHIADVTTSMHHFADVTTDTLVNDHYCLYDIDIVLVGLRYLSISCNRYSTR